MLLLIVVIFVVHEAVLSCNIWRSRNALGPIGHTVDEAAVCIGNYLFYFVPR